MKLSAVSVFLEHVNLGLVLGLKEMGLLQGHAVEFCLAAVLI